MQENLLSINEGHGMAINKVLSTVEVQMIMHGLDVQDLLQFSSCSKFLRSAASHKFAWKCTPHCLIQGNNIEQLSRRVNDACTYAISCHRQYIVFYDDIDQTETDISSLLKAISKHNQNVIGILLSHCSFSDDNNSTLFDLANVLRNSKGKLKYFGITSSQMNERGVFELSDAIRSTPSIIALNFQCDMSQKCVLAIAPTFKTLVALDFSGNTLDHVSIKTIASVLDQNKTLTSLNLSGCSLRNKGIVDLALALKTSNHLINLDLSNNFLTSAGVVALIDSISAIPRLRQLNLKMNRIRNAGAFKLSELIQRSTCITSIDLASNKIRNQGALQLRQALENSKTINYIDLKSNRFNTRVVKESLYRERDNE